MALSVDELGSRYGLYGVNGMTQTDTQNTKTSKTEQKDTDGDSYISTIAGLDLDAAIPSENYNDFARKLKAAVAAGQEQDSTEYASVADGTSQTAEAGGTQAAGGASGGGGSSDSEEDTETEIVVINGVAYLQTTTTDEDGNTTVTRTQLSAPPMDDNGKEAGPQAPAAAQALSV